MKRYLFSRTADFALTGEKRLLNEESKAPEKTAATPASTPNPKHAELATHFKNAIAKDPLLGKALHDAVIKFIEEQVRDPKAAIEDVKHKALAVIDNLEEIKKMDHEKVMELRNAIPTNRAELVAIAINAGFLTMEDAMGAAAAGGKAAPGEVSINEFSSLNDPDLYAAIDDVRMQLRRQAAGAPKNLQREAMDKYRKLNAVLDSRKGMTIPDLVRRAPHYLPTSTQPTAQQQMADAMSRNAQRERFEETNTGDPLFGNSAAGRSFQNMLARKRHETERRMSGEERARYEIAKEWNKDIYTPPSYIYSVPKNFRPAPRMGADGKMHEVDMDQYMYYQPGTPGGFFDQNSPNRGVPFGGNSARSSSGRSRKGMFGNYKVNPKDYDRTVDRSTSHLDPEVQDDLRMMGTDRVKERALAMVNKLRVDVQPPERLANTLLYKQLEYYEEKANYLRDPRDIKPHYQKMIQIVEQIRAEIEKNDYLQNEIAKGLTKNKENEYENTTYIPVAPGLLNKVYVIDNLTKKRYEFQPQLFDSDSGDAQMQGLQDLRDAGIAVALVRGGKNPWSTRKTIENSNKQYVTGVHFGFVNAADKMKKNFTITTKGPKQEFIQKTLGEAAIPPGYEVPGPLEPIKGYKETYTLPGLRKNTMPSDVSISHSVKDGESVIFTPEMLDLNEGQSVRDDHVGVIIRKEEGELKIYFMKSGKYTVSRKDAGGTFEKLPVPAFESSGNSLPSGVGFINEAAATEFTNEQNEFLKEIRGVGLSSTEFRLFGILFSMQTASVGEGAGKKYYVQYTDKQAVDMARDLLKNADVTNMIDASRYDPDTKNQVSYAAIVKNPKGLLNALKSQKEKLINFARMKVTNFSEFLSDPAIESVDKIDDNWIKEDPTAATTAALTPTAFLQLKFMIARNLFFQRKDVSKETVQAEKSRIEATRNKLKDVEVFAGRNVVHIAHIEHIRDIKNDGQTYTEEQIAQYEKSSGDIYRFGKEGTKNAIEAQQKDVPNSTYERIRPEKSEGNEKLKEAKTKVLEKIKTMTSPSTFIFDGHGGPDAFYLSDGGVMGTVGSIEEKMDTVKITPAELAAAWKARKNAPADATDPKKQDIFIFASCYNSNFIRTFYRQIGKGPKPITLGMSEFGQYGYSTPESKFGAEFFSDVLQMKDVTPSKKTKLSDVFEHEIEDISNSSLYVPTDSDQGMMQVTENKQGDESLPVA